MSCTKREREIFEIKEAKDCKFRKFVNCNKKVINRPKMQLLQEIRKKLKKYKNWDQLADNRLKHT